MNLYEMIDNHQNRLQQLLQVGYVTEIMYQELYNKFWDSLPKIINLPPSLDKSISILPSATHTWPSE